MPELPEVETVRRFLESVLLKGKAKKIKSIIAFYPGIIKHDAVAFINTLVGQSFT
jgi:formamidopyrimidine-DNA glycosylase